MQLKLRRTQRDGGLVSKSVIFCLDARAEFTLKEQQNLRRYKLHNQVLYNSEAQKQLLDRSAASQDGSFRGNVKSLAFAAFAATKLNVSVNSIQQGQHIECKSMDELLGAEDALMTACENLKNYLEIAATFDGREVVVSFDNGPPAIIAEATPPQQQLIAPAPAPMAAIAAPSPVEYIEQDNGEWQPAYDDSSYLQQGSLEDRVMDYLSDPANKNTLIIGGIVVVVLLYLLFH